MASRFKLMQLSHSKQQSLGFYLNFVLQIIKAVLRVTIMDVNFNNKDEANATNEMIVDLVNMMFTELRHFTSAVLYNIVETCLEYIKDDKDKDKEDFLRPR